MKYYVDIELKLKRNKTSYQQRAVLGMQSVFVDNSCWLYILHIPFFLYFCTMENKAAIALFGMSGLLILFAAYVSFLPDILESKAEVKVKASKTDVVRYLTRARDWETWLFKPEIKESSSWRTMASGKDTGEGSVLKWFSESIGDGGLEIKKIDTNQIVFERISDNGGFEDRCYLDLISDGDYVVIKMIDSLSIKSNFIARYEAQDDSYIKMIDSSNVEVLRRLKSNLETKK